MDSTKKIYSSAKLKTLPAEKQQAIVIYLDGDEAEEKAHSLKATISWLRADGVSTSSASLSEFRSWFLLRQQMQRNEVTALELVQDFKEKDLIKSAAEEQAAGQIFFTRLAMQTEDNLGFVRILREQTRQKDLAIQERRTKLLEEREAKTKQTVSNPDLTSEEKEAAVKQIFGLA